MLQTHVTVCRDSGFQMVVLTARYTNLAAGEST